MNTEVTASAAGKRVTATAELPALIERAGAVILERAKSITIRSDEDYQLASAFGVSARDERNRLDADRLKQTKALRDAVDETNEYFKVPIALFEQAIETTRQKMNDWNVEKKRLAAIETKRLEDARKAREDEARKVREAAAEKARLEELEKTRAAEAEAERARAAEESARAAERAAKAAQEAAEATARGATEEADRANAAAEASRKEAEDSAAVAAKARQDAVAARKAQLKAEAETDEANARAAEAAKQAAAAVPVGGVGGGLRVKGVRTKWVWKVREGAEIPRNYLTLDTEKVQGDVDRLKDRAGEVLPWLEVTSEESAQMRRR